MFAIQTHQPEGGLVDARPNIKVTPQWTMVYDDLADGGAAEVHVVYDRVLLRFAIQTFSISRRSEGHDVTGAMLRELRLQEEVRGPSLLHIWLPAPPQSRGLQLDIDGIAHWPAMEFLRSVKRIDKRYTPEDVRVARLIYDIAHIANMPPLKSVADSLGVSQSTATRMIAAARDRRADPPNRKDSDSADL